MMISNRSPSVRVVWYDKTGKAQSKLFTDPYEARRYYAQLIRQGLNPRVRRG